MLSTLILSEVGIMQKHFSLLNQHNTKFVIFRKGCVDSVYRKKRILLHRVPLTSVYLRSFHRRVPFGFFGSLKSAWRWGEVINHNTYGLTNRLFSLGNDVQLLRVPKSLQPLLPLQRPKASIHYATRATLPETGSRVDACITARIKHQSLP